MIGSTNKQTPVQAIAHSSTTAGVNTLIDALPYFDRGYEDESVREATSSLVVEELSRMKSEGKSLEVFMSELQTRLPDVFDTKVQPESEILRGELSRIEENMPMETLAMRRYELPGPPAAQKDVVSAWQSAVENAYSQIEHQIARIENLELLEKHGSQSWLVGNATLEAQLRAMERELSAARERIGRMNADRKREQLAAGAEIGRLESKWAQLVKSNYDVEQAIGQFRDGITYYDTHLRTLKDAIQQREAATATVPERGQTPPASQDTA